MTKATIIDVHADGEYTVQVEEDTTYAQEQIDSIGKRLPQVELDVLQASVAVLDAQTALNAATLQLDQTINEVIGDGGSIDDPKIKDDVVKVQETNIELFKARNAEANLKATRASLVSRKTALENAITFSNRSPFRCWCADYTIDLQIKAAVAMALVPGEDVGYTWTIRPGYEDSAEWSHDKNGFLTPGYSTTPEQFFYNLAMLPGWQRFVPTYRFGRIIDFNADNTVNVLVDDARSSQKSAITNVRFGVNFLRGQPTTLENVPIKYMYCHWEAFEVDDHVVIEFEQDTSGNLQTIGWGDPTIIGFVTNPKICLLWHECGLFEYRLLALGFAPTSYLYYPEKIRDLIAPYGGAIGELIDTDKPLWLDYTGTIGGILATRFRVYDPGMDSRSVNEQRTGPTRANRFSDGRDYKQLAATNKLKFIIQSNMGNNQGGFGWLTPFCWKPNAGRTFAIYTDIIYPNEAKDDLPARLEYWLVVFNNTTPVAFYKLQYDERNAGVIAARQAFYDLGRATPGDSQTVKDERLRTESVVAAAIEAPDWDEISGSPDYETPLPWLISGNTFDYGVHVSWHGDRFGIVTHEKSLNHLGNAEYDTARFWYGTISKNRAAEIDKRIQFDVNWAQIEEKEWTGQIGGDYILVYDPEKKLHEWKPWAPNGETGAWQLRNEPAAPVFCFFDLDDRFNILRHYRNYNDDTFQPQPPNWDTFQDEVFTCTPLSSTATGTLTWNTSLGYDDHGFYLERETEPGSGVGDIEEVWRYVESDTVGPTAEIRTKTYDVSANVLSLDVVDLDVTDSWWGDTEWSCDPDDGPFVPPSGNSQNYEQTVHQGNGLSDFFRDNTTQRFRSYLILPGYDGSSVIAGYQTDKEDLATHYINWQTAAIAVEDTPGRIPDDPGSGRIMEWKVSANLDNGNRLGGSGQIPYLLNRPRWRVEGLMTLTGKTLEPIETAALQIWLNATGDSEPQGTDELPPGADPYDYLDQLRGRWAAFDGLRTTDPYIFPFRVKWSSGGAGYYLGDFNAANPEDAQARTDDGLPYISGWDFAYMGSA